MAGFVLNVDPVMLRVGPYPLYWYGFAYTSCFAVMWAWLNWRRDRLGGTSMQVVDASIVLVLGVIVGGRAIEVTVYEWGWYGTHLWEIPMLWKGGMSTHGLLAGSVLSALVIARRTGTPLLVLLDELSCPAAIIFGLGRIGNFIEGGVIGTPTDLPWGVKIPGVERFRHPVSLYDGLKNLALVPVLLAVLRQWPAGTGIATGVFSFGYGGLRFLVDQLRDYESSLFGMGAGQWFNLAMAGIGVMVLIGRRRATAPTIASMPNQSASRWRIALLILLIVLPLCIPTSWTRTYLELKRLNPA